MAEYGRIDYLPYIGAYSCIYENMSRVRRAKEVCPKAVRVDEVLRKAEQTDTVSRVGTVRFLIF